MKSKSKQRIVLGMDLGTTFSVLCIFEAAKSCKIIPNAEGDLLTPSVVDLRDESKPVIGRAAENQRAFAPECTASLFKRSMGREDSAGESIAAFVHPDSNTPYPPELLSSFVIRYIVESAEAALGNKAAGVVISVPAYFDSNARAATRRAAELAGFNVFSIINEPTAAALAFGFDRSESGTLAVFDLGGGTFDITILQILAEKFEVLATDGDRDTGGSDADNLIVASAVEAFLAEHGIEITPESDLINWRDILDKAENAKKVLSQAQKAEFMISVGDKRLIFELTRAEFESVIAPIVSKTKTITERALAAAKLTPNDIDHVVLVGGSTRIPAVRAMLTSIFGDKLRTDINPDEAVAMGASILAARHAGDTGITVVDSEGEKVLPPPVEIYDVTSQPLGCLAMKDGEMLASVIIPANTRLPADEEDTFGLEREGQTIAQVTIVSGPNGAKAEDCIVYGDLTLADLTTRPVGDASIKVQYEFTAEGKLKVTATDTISGKSTSEIKKGLGGLVAGYTES